MALRSVRKSLKFDDEFIVNTKFIGNSKIICDDDLDNIQIRGQKTISFPKKKESNTMILKTRKFSEYDNPVSNCSMSLQLKKVKTNWLCNNLQDYLKCDEEKFMVKDFMEKSLKAIKENEQQSKNSILISPQVFSQKKGFLMTSDQFVKSIYNTENQSVEDSGYKEFQQLKKMLFKPCKQVQN